MILPETNLLRSDNDFVHIVKIPVFIVIKFIIFPGFRIEKGTFSSLNGENLIKFQSWFSKFYYVIKNYKVVYK